MKIGVNTRIFQNKGSGIPYYIQCLYTALQAIDRNNSYVFFQTETTKTLGTTFTFTVWKNYLGSLFFDLFAVNRLAKQHRVAIVHGPSHFLPFIKLPRIKYVLTIHDLFLLKFPNLSDWKFRTLFRILVGRSLQIADVIVADSHNTKRDIIDLYRVHESKIQVVHLGVHEYFLKDSTPERIYSQPYFFTLTTHAERKNILKIVEIFGESSELHANYHFVIAGILPQAQIDLVKSIAQRYGLQDKVILWGYAQESELVSLYSYAAFFIYPSFYEGFGLPVVEAMMSNCPVITSNTSSLPELVPDDEWLVDPHNKANISSTIKQLLALSTEERAALIEKNKTFARQFTWQRTAEKMLSIYKGLHDI